MRTCCVRIVPCLRFQSSAVGEENKVRLNNQSYLDYNWNPNVPSALVARIFDLVLPQILSLAVIALWVDPTMNELQDMLLTSVFAVDHDFFGISILISIRRVSHEVFGGFLVVSCRTTCIHT